MAYIRDSGKNKKTTPTTNNGWFDTFTKGIVNTTGRLAAAARQQTTTQTKATVPAMPPAVKTPIVAPTTTATTRSSNKNTAANKHAATTTTRTATKSTAAGSSAATPTRTDKALALHEKQTSSTKQAHNQTYQPTNRERLMEEKLTHEYTPRTRIATNPLGAPYIEIVSIEEQKEEHYQELENQRALKLEQERQRTIDEGMQQLMSNFSHTTLLNRSTAEREFGEVITQPDPFAYALEHGIADKYDKAIKAAEVSGLLDFTAEARDAKAIVSDYQEFASSTGGDLDDYVRYFKQQYPEYANMNHYELRDFIKSREYVALAASPDYFVLGNKKTPSDLLGIPAEGIETALNLVGIYPDDFEMGLMNNIYNKMGPAAVKEYWNTMDSVYKQRHAEEVADRVGGDPVLSFITGVAGNIEEDVNDLALAFSGTDYVPSGYITATRDELVERNNSFGEFQQASYDVGYDMFKHFIYKHAPVLSFLEGGMIYGKQKREALDAGIDPKAVHDAILWNSRKEFAVASSVDKTFEEIIKILFPKYADTASLLSGILSNSITDSLIK